jgi:hypothetical protein
MAAGIDRPEARAQVREAIGVVLAKWRERA